ncbi:MAG TPA: hypothetical protein VK665_11550 [Candidatus Elarobacter sp.]|nr:hypothetical protein [Candidatus Elarobacter sp.]
MLFRAIDGHAARRSLAALAIGLAALAAWVPWASRDVWQNAVERAIVWSWTFSRSPAGALAGWWNGVAADHASAVCAVGLVLAAAAVFAFALIVLRRSGSIPLAAGASAVALCSALPAGWVCAPTGAQQSLAVLGIVAAFGAAAFGGAQRAIVPLAAFLAVAAEGWPAPAIVASAAALGRAGRPTIAAALLGLAARALAGIPLLALLGRWNAAESQTIVALRVVLVVLVALPLALYAGARLDLRRRIGPRVAAIRADAAPAAACVVLAATAPFVVHAAAAEFALLLAATAIAAGALARRSDAIAVNAARIAIACAAVAGVVARGGAPAGDAATLARDGAVVRAAAARSAAIDVVGTGTARERYSPSLIAYLAGRPVDVRYPSEQPAHATGAIVLATANGLVPIDENLRAFDALAAARRGVAYDFGAKANTCAIAAPAALRGQNGVFRDLPIAAPGGHVAALTVVSAYSCTFSNVPVAPGNRLVYALTLPNANSDGARATVTVEIPGQPPVVANDDVPPAPSPEAPLWRFRAVDLHVGRPALARVAFSGSSPSGNGIADWLSFAGAAIVAR